jgi:PST family polysaccharide transporter
MSGSTADRTPPPVHSGRWSGLRADAFWQLMERGTRLALGFAMSLLIARQLGPGSFGIYSFAVSLVALFAFLGQAGLEAILLRELVRDPGGTRANMSSSLLLRLAGAVLAGIAAVALAIATASGELASAPLLVMILSFSGVMQAGWIVEPWLQVHDEFRRAALAKIAAYAVAAALRLAALATDQPLVFLALATVSESALCALLLWLAALRRRGGGPGRLSWPDPKHLRQMARLVAPMLLSALTVALYSRLDVFMLGVMIGPEAAGLYSAATLVSEGFYLLPTAVMAAAAPRLARLYVADHNAFAASLARLVRLLSTAGLLIVGGTLLAAPFVVPLLFGQDYAPADVILRIHIWSTWMVFVSTACDSWYVNRDLRHLYLAKTGLAALLNLVLNLLLIPYWQGVGAALATVLSYGMSAIGFNLVRA